MQSFAYMLLGEAVILKTSGAVSWCSKTLQDMCCIVAVAMLALQCGQVMLLQRISQMFLLRAKMVGSDCEAVSRHWISLR